MQQTNFRYEAIVHDDASTDNTADIIRDYAEKYPDIIKPIFEEENQHSKGTLGDIINNACTGRYVALCEGDDYWTDPLKLQKQVDFLESHSAFSMCFHNAMSHWESCEMEDSQFSNVEDKTYTGIEIYEKWIVPTASVTMRREVFQSDIYIQASHNKKFCYGDIIMFLSCAACGKLYGMSDVMSVYRRHEGSAVFSYAVNRQIRQAYHSLEIYKVFGTEYKSLSIEKFYKNGLEAFLNAKAEGEIHYSLLCDLVRYAPKKTFSAFWAMLKRKVQRSDDR